MSRGLGSRQRYILERLAQGGGGMCLDTRCLSVHPLGAVWAKRGWVPSFELVPRDAPPPADARTANVGVSADGSYWIESKYAPTRSELMSVQRALRGLRARGLIEVDAEHRRGWLVRLTVSDEQREAEQREDREVCQAASLDSPG